MKIQIGVIGSYSDIKYPIRAEREAERVGEEIARRGAILITGAEIGGGLCVAAAKGARREGGLVVAVVRSKEMACRFADIIIQVGASLWGLREYLLPICCDAMIAIAGGSGTLNEIAVAYQNNIPVVLLLGFGGTVDELGNVEYLDGRKKVKFATAKSASEAVELAIKLVKEKLRKKLN